jgi:hypothetical protein
LAGANIAYRSIVELGNLFIDCEDWRERYACLWDRAGDILAERLWHLPAPFCLMGAEKRATECHRQRIADYLVEQGYVVAYMATTDSVGYVKHATQRRRQDDG